MPIKERFDDSDHKAEDDIALEILAGYREGLTEKEKQSTKQDTTKKEKQTD